MRELSVKSRMIVSDEGLATDFLYVQLLGKIKGLIRNSTLKPGDKLLSIRALSKEQGISITTLYKAYSDPEEDAFYGSDLTKKLIRKNCFKKPWKIRYVLLRVIC
jgi:DNA-binding transcriptional regulator YhcF (GntR family)